VITLFHSLSYRVGPVVTMPTSPATNPEVPSSVKGAFDRESVLVALTWSALPDNYYYVDYNYKYLGDSELKASNSPFSEGRARAHTEAFSQWTNYTRRRGGGNYSAST